jgi:hypothetical protein
MGPRRQMDQPQRLVEIPIEVARPPIAANLVFLAQPLAEPLRDMGVDRSISRTDWTEGEVIRPAGQFPVQPSHDKLGIQEGSATVSFLIDNLRRPAAGIPQCLPSEDESPHVQIRQQR